MSTTAATDDVQTSGNSARAKRAGSNPKRERYKKFVAFLGTAVGATIVLGTWLANDELREQAKDAAQDVDSKISQYSIAMQGNDTMAQVRSLGVTSVIDANQNSNSSKSGIDWSIVEMFNRQTIAEADNAARMLDTAREFIPETAMSSFVKRCDELLKEQTNLRSQITKAIGLKSARDGNQLLEQTMAQLDTFVLELHGVLDGLREYVTQHMNNQRDAAQHIYDDWSIVSYFFYALGWLVAVVGKYVGIQSPDAG